MGEKTTAEHDRLRTGAVRLSREVAPMLLVLAIPALIVLALVVHGESIEPRAAQPAASPTPGLYDGFRFEQVGVGVKRLIDDGAGHRPGDQRMAHGLSIEHLADLIEVKPDGAVLRCCDRPAPLFPSHDEIELQRFGEDDPVASWDGWDTGTDDIAGMAVAADGSVWLAGAGIATIVDGEWEWVRQYGRTETVAVGPDGTVWASLSGKPPRGAEKPPRLVRIRDGKARVLAAGKGLPEAVRRWDGQVTGITSTPSGHLWVGVGGRQARGAGGLLRFDGERWRVLHPLGRDTSSKVDGVATAPDGTLWLYLTETKRGAGGTKRTASYLVRREADGWTTFGATDGIPRRTHGQRAADGVPMQVGPEGTVWFAPPGAAGCARLVTFDGDVVQSRLRGSACVHDLALDAEGRAWVSALEDGLDPVLYLVDP